MYKIFFLTKVIFTNFKTKLRYPIFKIDRVTLKLVYGNEI